MEEDGRGGRRAEETISLCNCGSLKDLEAETQLDRREEETPKNSALNFQRSLKHKRVLTWSIVVEQHKFNVNTNVTNTDIV